MSTAMQESKQTSEANIITGRRQGGTGGKPFDDFEFSRLHITSIHVQWDRRINAIQVTYEGGDTAKLHGEKAGQSDTFNLEPGEKIVRIEGFADDFINQLQFTTDAGRWLSFDCV
ncbi:hypothetical protein JR316_0007640 [Psilocybe cubensis]|uniref:Uncharacterized protein n=1 Tax=Psilocybe cubensis TaxID=181762 RepID=A0ACB8GTV2_PSICU|nr:hypothetical protein JR316_0007640 [Psilocybe cubensis]KAH9479063.1 hypothetical protein JR316_0007640 [Psilocybe cubensis]